MITVELFSKYFWSTKEGDINCVFRESIPEMVTVELRSKS